MCPKVVHGLCERRLWWLGRPCARCGVWIGAIRMGFCISIFPGRAADQPFHRILPPSVERDASAAEDSWKMGKQVLACTNSEKHAFTLWSWHFGKPERRRRMCRLPNWAPHRNCFLRSETTVSRPTQHQGLHLGDSSTPPSATKVVETDPITSASTGSSQIAIVRREVKSFGPRSLDLSVQLPELDHLREKICRGVEQRPGFLVCGAWLQAMRGRANARWPRWWLGPWLRRVWCGRDWGRGGE